jgi:hypothetical protein
MSGHHPVQAMTAQAPAAEAQPALDGRRARLPLRLTVQTSGQFYDQQTGQVVAATVVTADTLTAFEQRRRQQAGLPGLAGPPPTVGDWVVGLEGGGVPLQARVVVQPDFLLRYAPADEAARQLLQRLNQPVGHAGAGDPAVAARLQALRDSATPRD